MIVYTSERVTTELLPHNTSQRQQSRDDIARHTAEFKQGGGVVQQIPRGVSGLDTAVVKHKNGRTRWAKDQYTRLFLDKRDGKGRQPAKGTVGKSK